MSIPKDEILSRLKLAAQSTRFAQRRIRIGQLLSIPEPQEFLTEAYRILLGRELDSDGLTAHLRDLEARVPRLQLLHSIRNSEEGRKRKIEALADWPYLSFDQLRDVPDTAKFLTLAYRNYLWRDPDIEGANYFKDKLARGVPRTWVLHVIGASREAASRGATIPEQWQPKTFQSLLDLRDEDFVPEAYRTIFWRESDVAGRQAFESCLRNGTPRQWILWRMQSSDEGRSIGQDVVPPEWQPKTFQDLLGLPGNEEFLTAAYRTYLWRNPDESGRKTYLGLLQKGAPRPYALYCIGTSKEALALASSFPDDWLPKRAAEMASAPEPAFLQIAYRTILWRDPDSAGSRIYESQLLAGRPRMDIARELAQSAEARALPFRQLTLRELPLSPVTRWVWRARTAIAGPALYHTVQLRDTVRGTIAEISPAIAQTQQQISGVISKLDAICREFNSLAVNVSDLRESHGASLEELSVVSEMLAALSKDNDVVLSSLVRTQYDALSAIAKISEDGIESLNAGIRRQQDVLQLELKSLSKQQDAFVAGQQTLQAKLTETGTELTGLQNANRQVLVDRLVQAETLLAQAIVVNREVMQQRLPYPDSPVRSAISFPGLVVTQLEKFLYAIPAEDVRLASYLAFRGHLEPGLHRFFEKWVRPGMRVVDAGANVGLHSLFFGEQVGSAGKVYCFEPSPRVFPILSLNIALNDMMSRLVAHEIALSDNGPGSARFYVHDICGHSTLYNGGAPSQMVEVKTDSLDHLLDPSGSIDLIKIDVEGAEPLVLRGLASTIQANPETALVVEFAPSLLQRAGFKPAGFLAEIQSQGFTIAQIDDVSGELFSVDMDMLLTTFSANLLLTKHPARWT